MSKTEREEILRAAQSCFFAAMQVGWAAGAKGTIVPRMPGYKEVEYEGYAGFLVIDRYCVSSAGKSAGTTTIWFGDDPVWFMSYGGFYPKEVVPFLKRALMSSYNQCEFVGGRGPVFYGDDSNYPGLSYRNVVEKGSDFCSCFRGDEHILGCECLAWHSYWGRALI
jgi:hypothetical protein